MNNNFKQRIDSVIRIILTIGMIISVGCSTDNPEQLFGEGLKYSDQGEYGLAIKKYSEAIALDAQSSSPYYNRALAYLNIECYDSAITDFVRVLQFTEKSDDDESAINVLIGYCYLRREMLDSSIAFLNIAYTLDSLNTEALSYRAIAYAKQSKYNDALIDYNRALNIDSTDANLYYNRSILFMEMGNLDAAISDGEMAIYCSPEDAYIYGALSNLYYRQGSFDSALVFIDHALRVDSAFPDGLLLRAAIYEKMGEYQLALFELNMAISANPSDPYVYNNKGEVLRQIQSYDSAFYYYQYALGLDSTVAEVYHSLALAYSDIGDSEMEYESLLKFTKYMDLDDSRKDSASKRIEYLIQAGCPRMDSTNATDMKNEQ